MSLTEFGTIWSQPAAPGLKRIFSASAPNVFDETVVHTTWNSDSDLRISYSYLTISIFSSNRAQLVPDPKFDPIQSISVAYFLNDEDESISQYLEMAVWRAKLGYLTLIHSSIILLRQ